MNNNMSLIEEIENKCFEILSKVPDISNRDFILEINTKDCKKILKNQISYPLMTTNDYNMLEYYLANGVKLKIRIDHNLKDEYKLYYRMI